jgi:hypothetical protein
MMLFVGSALMAEQATVEGWVIDSACTYSKNLSEPKSVACAKRCARNGSPLVILTDDKTVLLPIENAVPARGQNVKLMKFAGQRVKATGEIFEHGGSKAIAIEKIEAAGSR